MECVFTSVTQTPRIRVVLIATVVLVLTSNRAVTLKVIALNLRALAKIVMPQAVSVSTDSYVCRTVRGKRQPVTVLAM